MSNTITNASSKKLSSTSGHKNRDLKHSYRAGRCSAPKIPSLSPAGRWSTCERRKLRELLKCSGGRITIWKKTRICSSMHKTIRQQTNRSQTFYQKTTPHQQQAPKDHKVLLIIRNRVLFKRQRLKISTERSGATTIWRLTLRFLTTCLEEPKLPKKERQVTIKTIAAYLSHQPKELTQYCKH